MPARSRTGTVAAGLVVLAALVAGCAGGPAVPALRHLDWADRSYPSRCFSPHASSRVLVRHDLAGGANGITMQVAPPVFGDVDGDGHPDAVVTYRCVGANAGPDTALVYLARPRGPVLVATLLGGENIYVTRVQIGGRAVRFAGYGYTPGAPHCCPDLQVQLVYRWRGGRLLLTARHSAPLHR